MAHDDRDTGALPKTDWRVDTYGTPAQPVTEADQESTRSDDGDPLHGAREISWGIGKAFALIAMVISGITK